GWITFPFPAPFAYNGRDNLMVDFRFSSRPSFFVTGLCYVFQTSENRAFTGGPSLGFGTNQVPNIRWTTRQAFAVTPEYVVHFVNGSWTGNVVVTEPATAMSLYTMDGANRVTEGNPFEVIPDDMDGDGIGDAWAVQYFGHTPLESTTAPDGKWGDKDGDGVSNFAEYISGTDPTNGQSVFKVDPISLAAGQIGLT